MSIILSNNTKITNPLTRSDVMSYEGPIIGVDLCRQKRNFVLISNKLNDHGIFLDYIWFAKFNRENKEVYHFVAKSNDNRIHWRKYEGNASGSGQNWIYIDGIKYKTTTFLSWNNETLLQKLTPPL